MIGPAEPPRRGRTLLEVLAVELAPRAGRWAAVARIATGCSVTVAIAMVFQIPEPTYMAYVVFAISKDQGAATVTAALGGLAAVTLAIILTLGLALIDTAEPALRLPFMAAATFLAIFTARTCSLGPISYLAGFVIVLLQSLVDDVRSPEALTRAILWIWVVILVPVVVTVVVNVLFGQGAAALVERTVTRILEQLEAALLGGDHLDRLAGWRATLVPLLAGVDPHPIAAGSRPVTAPMLAALLDALVILQVVPGDLPDDIRRDLGARVGACRRAIAQHDGVSAFESSTAGLPSCDRMSAAAAPVAALVDALSRFMAGGAASSSTAPAERPRRPLFVTDAFTNPAYWQYALKTTMAVMVSYTVYTLLDWPGLRTAIVTCFFVALSSLGETIHKLVLRLSGALIGGLIAGVCIVFVLPELTDIGQLCLLIGVVSLGAAWIATSSELLSYAGLQIAFAFFLGVLQGYAPATDLTVLRDRIAGIFLGNVVITVIFSSVWPESAQSAARAAIAAALRSISAVLVRQAAQAPRSALATQATHLDTAQALVRADHFRALSLFELRMLPRHAAATPDLEAVERLAGAAFVATSAPIAAGADRDSLARIGRWAGSGRRPHSAGYVATAAPRRRAAHDRTVDGIARRHGTTRGRAARVGGPACVAAESLNTRCW